MSQFQKWRALCRHAASICSWVGTVFSLFWFVFILNFLIQRRPTRTLFYSNFQGFTYCSIFDFQGSLLLSVSAATLLVYQMLFCLSTTFFIFVLHLKLSFLMHQLVYNNIRFPECQALFSTFFTFSWSVFYIQYYVLSITAF